MIEKLPPRQSECLPQFGRWGVDLLQYQVAMIDFNLRVPLCFGAVLPKLGFRRSGSRSHWKGRESTLALLLTH